MINENIALKGNLNSQLNCWLQAVYARMARRSHTICSLLRNLEKDCIEHKKNALTQAQNALLDQLPLKVLIECSNFDGIFKYAGRSKAWIQESIRIRYEEGPFVSNSYRWTISLMNSGRSRKPPINVPSDCNALEWSLNAWRFDSRSWNGSDVSIALRRKESLFVFFWKHDVWSFEVGGLGVPYLLLNI